MYFIFPKPVQWGCFAGAKINPLRGSASPKRIGNSPRLLLLYFPCGGDAGDGSQKCRGIVGRVLRSVTRPTMTPILGIVIGYRVTSQSSPIDCTRLGFRSGRRCRQGCRWGCRRWITKMSRYCRPCSAIGDLQTMIPILGIVIGYCFTSQSLPIDCTRLGFRSGRRCRQGRR